MALEATITRLRQEYLNAINAGDGKALLDIWHPEGTMMAPNMPTLRGHAAIAKGFEAFGAMGLKRLEFTQARLEQVGDLVLDAGGYRVELQPPGGPVIRDEGKDLRIWRRVDGGWKLYLDTWNTDLPPPGMG